MIMKTNLLVLYSKFTRSVARVQRAHRLGSCEHTVKALPKPQLLLRFSRIIKAKKLEQLD